MLKYLPVRHKEQWWLISDRKLATSLRKLTDKKKLSSWLAKPLSRVLEDNELELENPKTYRGENEISDVIKHLDSSHLPVLVTDGASSNLVGIVTAYDLL